MNGVDCPPPGSPVTNLANTTRGTVSPNPNSPPVAPPPQQDSQPNPCEESGSIIECQSQVLGESFELAGTAFDIQYRSDRVPGRRAAYDLAIPLSGELVPSTLDKILLVIEIPGRTWNLTFGPSAAQTHFFTWDRRDAAGREIEGAQPIAVKIGWVHDAKTTKWSQWNGVIGQLDARALGLGGWHLDAQHHLDPQAGMLYMASGEIRPVEKAKRKHPSTDGREIYEFSADGRHLATLDAVTGVTLLRFEYH